MNFGMLKLLAERYDGLIIVPMTLVNRGYYDEIITRLAGGGVDVRHFVLYAGRETILRRLRSRSFGRPDEFAVQSIDRCVSSFDTSIKDIRIVTDGKSAGEVAAEIAEKSGISLATPR